MAAPRFPAPAQRHEDATRKHDNALIQKEKNIKNLPDGVPGNVQGADPFLQPGIKPVIELLQNDPAKIDAVFIKKGRKDADTSKIIDLCRKNGVRFSLVDDASLARIWKGRHQGVIARLFDKGFVELPDLLETAASDPLPLILALDQVQDPGNAGALARTLYALGGSGLIVPRHNGVYLGAAAARVSAGALEKLPVTKVANLAQALDTAIDAGYTVYGADTAKQGDELDATSAFGFTPRLPAVLVLGGEEGGIRPVVRKRCSAVISIPFAREFDSLNVAQAGGIIIGAFAAAQTR
ncbi:MAG: 23S rRNA (guanosine-2'-O-)-methyltransferase RlmB [Desulfovibrio sp.]